MNKKPVHLRVNGVEKSVFVDEGANLLDVLRRSIGDVSVKYGCGQGTCGACGVMIDGVLQLSCLCLAEAADGSNIETVNSLANGDLHPLQQAFMDNFGAQCGFCTPGMLMAARALLDKTPSPTREQVIEAISGNICRCTGYEPIIHAILDAADRMTSQQKT